MQHGFNAANDKLIRVLGDEISSKQGNKSDVLVSELFEDITAPQTRWHRVAKPVLLHNINSEFEDKYSRPAGYFPSKKYLDQGAQIFF